MHWAVTWLLSHSEKAPYLRWPCPPAIPRPPLGPPWQLASTAWHLEQCFLVFMCVQAVLPASFHTPHLLWEPHEGSNGAGFQPPHPLPAPTAVSATQHKSCVNECMPHGPHWIPYFSLPCWWTLTGGKIKDILCFVNSWQRVTAWVFPKAALLELSCPNPVATFVICSQSMECGCPWVQRKPRALLN